MSIFDCIDSCWQFLTVFLAFLTVLTVVDHIWPCFNVFLVWSQTFFFYVFTISDHFWPLLSLVDHTWPFLTSFDSIDHIDCVFYSSLPLFTFVDHWLGLHRLERAWTCLNSLEQAWTGLNGLEQAWQGLNTLEHAWTGLNTLFQAFPGLKRHKQAWRVWPFGLYIVKDGAFRGSWGVLDVVLTRPIYHEKCIFFYGSF